MTVQPQNPLETARPKMMLRRRIRAIALLTAICLFPLAVIFFGVYCLRRAFLPHADIEPNVLWLFASVSLLSALLLLTWRILRRRWTTGRWMKTKEQSMQQLQALRTTGRSTPYVPAARWGWLPYSVAWANYVARNPQAPFWQRVAGWIIVSLSAAALAGCIAMGLVLFGAGFDTINTGGSTMIGFGLIVFFIPAAVVVVLIHHKRKYGNFLTSLEDLEQIRSKDAQSRLKESQKPMSTKLASTAGVLAVCAFWWIWALRHHNVHNHDDWSAPGGWTCVVAYQIYLQFRKPKYRPSNSITTESSEA